VIATEYLYAEHQDLLQSRQFSQRFNNWQAALNQTRKTWMLSRRFLILYHTCHCGNRGCLLSFNVALDQCSNRHANSLALKIPCHEAALHACCRSNWKGVVDARGQEGSLHVGSNRHTDSVMLTVVDDKVALPCLPSAGPTGKVLLMPEDKKAVFIMVATGTQIQLC